MLSELTLFSWIGLLLIPVYMLALFVIVVLTGGFDE